MDIAKINRLNNEYNALIREAVEIRVDNNDVPSVQEGLRYQKAAQICSELARMTIGSEELHWVQEKNKCEKHMRDIATALGIGGGSSQQHKKPVSPARKPDPAPDKPTRRKSAAKNGSDSGASDVPQKTVDSWFSEEELTHSLSDVVGMKDTIALLNSCVADVGHQELDEYLDMPTVRSFFFYGPPGCGKTFTIEGFAYDLIHQKGYNYMKLGSADIHSKFSGEADKIVERAFLEAAKNAPCILFIDEIDGVCQNRSMPHLSDFNMQLTTTFLTCFNNLNKLNKERKSVIFIGATNYPANVDAAMLDRVELVQIPLPDAQLRAHSFARKFQNVKLEEGFSWDDVAELTEGYNQRDINRVVDRIRLLMRKELVSIYSDDRKAISAMKTGEFRLSRSLVKQALSEYMPTPKNDVEAQLSAFEAQVRRC